MAENHVIVAGYAAGGYTKTRPAFQYDYGQELQLQGFPELPASFEMHFSIGMGQAITRIGTDGAVAVPNACLERFGTLTAWLFLHDAETDGETKYVIEIPVRSRAKATDQEPTPAEQSVITEAIAALNAGVTAAEAAQSAAEDAKGAAESARDAAETAQGKAEDAQGAAETAQDKAEDAQAAAEEAQGKAEDAKEAAETAQGKAEEAQEAAEAAVEAYDAMTAEATTLQPGSSATAEIDHSGDHPVLLLGLPQGATGSKGDKGDPGEVPIDDTAGAGDTTKVWSADKISGELSDVKSALNELYDDGIVKEHLQMEWYGIAESTGENNTNSKYIRTPGYLEFDGVAIIRKSTSSVMYVYKYASNGTFQSPAKYYNNSVTTIQLASETGYKYRISYAHYPVAEIAYADVPDVAKEFTIEYPSKEIARKTQADTNTNNIALLQSAFVDKQDFSGFTKTTSQIAYENNGVVTIASGNSYSKYTTYKYMLSGVTEFKVSCDVKGTVISLCIVCDDSDNVLEKIGYFGDNNLHSFENYVFTVNNPNADYVYFVDYNDSNTTLTKYFSILSPAPKSLSADGRWFNKKIVCFGDSRTWYDGQNYNNNTKDEWKGHACVGYQKTIEKLLGCQTINQGVSGENSISICTRIRAYDFSGADAVLLEGGVNDWIVSPNADIGTIAPIGSTFDTTTVYGAWQSAVEYVMTNYPDVSIYIDTPCIAWATSSDVVFPYSIAEVKKNVAELYNLPCKDMYKEAGITVINRDYFYVDNVSTTYWRLHFNDYGNAWIGARLAEFINVN